MIIPDADRLLYGHLLDVLGFNAEVSSVAIRLVREYDRKVATGEATVTAMMARAVARQCETITALGDQILELSKK